MKLLALICVLACAGCEHHGGIDERCLPDGSCIGKLECNNNGWGHICRIPVPPQPLASLRPARCNYESECFCTTCADKCTKGVKTCAFSDSSVWGSKPSLCECNQ